MHSCLEPLHPHSFGCLQRDTFGHVHTLITAPFPGAVLGERPVWPGALWRRLLRHALPDFHTTKQAYRNRLICTYMGAATTRSANNLHSLAGNCCRRAEGRSRIIAQRCNCPGCYIVGPKIVGS
jgi:hypothetical protein